MLLTLALTTIYFLCLHNVESFPTVHKRRYTFLTSGKTNWNDINKHCKENHNGHIFTMHDETVAKVIDKYKGSSPWESSWGDDIWIGMYMTDHSQKDYTWLGECSSSSPTFFDWECGNNCDPTLDHEKLCGKAKKDELVWDFEKCSIDFNGICEEITGNCDFEEHSGPGCIIHSSNKAFSTVVNKDKCQDLCRTEVKSGQECWTATYDQNTQQCTLSYDSDPFKFDSNKSPFKDCTPANSAVVSWKRCFDPAATSPRSIKSNSYQNDLKPQMTCTNTPVASPTTTPLTTTTLVDTTKLQPLTTLAETTKEVTTTLAETTTTTAETKTATTEATTITAAEKPTTTLAETTTITLAEKSTTILADKTSTLTETAPITRGTSPTQSETTTELLTNKTTSGENQTTTNTRATSTDYSTSTVMLQTSAKDNSTWQTTEANLACACSCYDNLSIALIQATIDELKKELLVNKKETSLYRRSLTSAPDDRPSAVGIGMILGMAVIVFVIFCLIIGDVVKVIRWFGEAIKKKSAEVSNI